MPYRVKEPEVTLLLKIGEILNNKEHVAWEHASATFLKDDVVYEDDNDAKKNGQVGPLSPHVVDLYEEGDAHTCAVIEKVDDEAPVSTAKPAKRGRPAAKSNSDTKSE